MSVPLFRKIPLLLAGLLLAPLVALAQTGPVQLPDDAGQSRGNGAAVAAGIADVIRQVDQAEDMVGGLEQNLASPDPDLEEAGSRLAELRASVEEDLRAVDGVLLEQYTALDLGGKLQTLAGADRRLREIRTLLQKTVDRLDGQRIRLRDYADYMGETGRGSGTEPLPGTLRERIDRVSGSIRAQRGRLDQRLGVAVAQLDGTTEFQRQLAAGITTIQGELARRQQSLLKLTEPPIWALSPAGAESPLTILGRELDNVLTGVAEYLRLHAMPVLLVGLLFVVLLVAGRRLPGSASPESGRRSSLIARSPLAVLVLVWALLGPELFLNDLITGLGAVRVLLIVGALWVLLPRLVVVPLMWPLRGLLLGALLIFGENHLLGDPFYGRLFLLALGAAALLLYYLLRRRLPAGPERSAVGSVAFWLARLAPPVLAAAILANLAGAVLLSGELISSLLFITVAMIGLVAVNGILQELLAAFVNGPGRRWSRAIHRYPQLVIGRAEKTIGIALTVLFILYLPRMAPVLRPVWGRIAELLRTPFPLGTLDLSILDVLIFMFGVGLALAVSRLVRFLLEEDVFSRLPVAPGTASAASRLIYYALMLGGLMFAFAAAGMELGQLTLVVGALSLGIGFGLQNFVNNFVSGIVIAFERPFREGDEISVGSITGRIRTIGLRASRLRTADGAELIVPNGNLISGEVSNLTLSDRARRSEIRIGAGYGSDPRQVEQILLGIACSMDKVSKAPVPTVVFDGFGESSLDFTLRFWTPNAADRQNVANEVRFRIVSAFAEAGIVMPLPRREIYIRPDP